MRDLPIRIVDPVDPSTEVTSPTKYAILDARRQMIGEAITRNRVCNAWTRSVYEPDYARSLARYLDSIEAQFSWVPQYHRYVSSSTGNDANDGLTPSTPWQTLQKVHDELQAQTIPAYTHIHFKRGEVYDSYSASGTTSYNTTCLVDVDTDFIGFVGDWGTGDYPKIRYQVDRVTSGWTLDSGTVWKREFDDHPTGMWLTNDWTTPFYETVIGTSDLGSVHRDTAGTYYYDAATMMVYLDAGGVDPNTLDITFVLHNHVSGIHFFNGGCFAKWLRFEGFGKSEKTDIRYDGAVVAGGQDNTSGYAAIECEAFYCSANPFLQRHWRGGGKGLVYFARCKGGLGSYPGSVMSCGEQKFHVRDCECWGRSPVSRYHVSGNKEAFGYTVYTDCNSGKNVDTVIIYGMTLNDKWPTHRLPYLNRMRSYVETDYSDAGGIVVNCDFDSSTQLVGLMGNWGTWDVMVGSRVKVKLGNETSRSLFNTAWGSLALNCVLDVEFTGSGGQWSIWNTTGSYSLNIQNINFIFRPLSNHDVAMIYDANAGTSCSFVNCGIAIDGSYSSDMIGYAAIPYDHCAFYNCAIPIDATNSVTASTLDIFDGTRLPTSNDETWAAGLDIGNKADYRFGPRSTLPEIGAYRHVEVG